MTQMGLAVDSGLKIGELETELVGKLHFNAWCISCHQGFCIRYTAVPGRDFQVVSALRKHWKEGCNVRAERIIGRLGHFKRWCTCTPPDYLWPAPQITKVPVPSGF